MRRKHLGLQVDSQWSEVRIAALSVAHGLISADSLELEPFVHEEFRAVWGEVLWTPISTNKTEFLQGVDRNEIRVDSVLFRYAGFEGDKKEVVVSPVIAKFFPVPGYPLMPLEMTFRRSLEGWQLVGIRMLDRLPQELVGNPTELHVLIDTAVSLRDEETGESIHARVRVTDSHGDYWPPVGHNKEFSTRLFEAVGGDVEVAGEKFAYVAPDFVLPLPPGSYVIKACRGLEYAPAVAEFEVSATHAPTVELLLRRWSNMAAEGWYSGDTHVHFVDPQVALVEAQGEDVNVTSLLATKWGSLITNGAHFTGQLSPVSTERHVVYVNQESRQDRHGHLTLHNLKALVHPLSWGAVRGVERTGVWGGSDYPPLSHVCDMAHEQGGYVVWAHFPLPNGELAAAAALGKIDAAEILMWGDPLGDKLESSYDAPGPFKAWYQLLNCGFRITAVAGSDKMHSTQIIGSPRVYAKVDGVFTYESWIKAVALGRTFVTSGPMLTATFNGEPPGSSLDLVPGDELAVVADVNSIDAVERVEVIRNGEVAFATENTSGTQRMRIETTLKVNDGCWVAVRAWARKRTPFQGYRVFRFPPLPVVAHTNPVYITAGTQGTRSSESALQLDSDLQRSIEWVKGSEAKFRDENEREEVLKLYEQAREVYTNLLELWQADDQTAKLGGFDGSRRRRARGT